MACGTVPREEPELAPTPATFHLSSAAADHHREPALHGDGRPAARHKGRQLRPRPKGAPLSLSAAAASNSVSAQKRRYAPNRPLERVLTRNPLPSLLLLSHPIKSYGEKVVNARIKLMFKSMNGKTMVATRNLKSTQEANKTKMRQLGGSLVIANADGSRENLSHHCTELNSQMETFLGVSKPILSNVIFCHQDESAWPMSEAGTLKKKFDEIFAAAR